MGCCGGKYKGVRRAPVPKNHLPGYSGIIAVRYMGKVKRARLPGAIYTGVRYEYGTGRPVFYVDARELTRVLAWTENGQKVFFVDGPVEAS